MKEAVKNTDPPRVVPGIVTHAREVLGVLLLALLCGLFLKVFALEAYYIPTPSMERTLLAGDYVLVNKFLYGPRTPRTLPFTSVRIPSVSLPGVRRPVPGDIVVFAFPGGPDSPPYQQAANVVKRCIGGPGNTVEIRGGAVRVNGIPFPLPHVSDAVSLPSVSRPDDFGPVVVPASGSRLFLSESTLEQWRGLIESEGHVVHQTPDGTILIDDRPTKEYRVARDYYFMLGDNLLNSLDSRTMGFVPEDAITGKVFLIYWSSGVQSNQGGLPTRLASVRWDRVGTVPR